MGNCMVAHNDNRVVSVSPKDDEKSKHLEGRKEDEMKTVRIRVMVTKQELKEIMMQHGNELKLEQIVMAVKCRENRGRRRIRRRRRVDCEEDAEEEEEEEEEEGVVNGGSWRPTLDSIPEDH
ncbi:hypothetical protein LINPERHAP1_LOCUS37209 [Linum perenne]